MNILAEAQKRMLETENPEARARLEAEFNELYFKTRKKKTRIVFLANYL